MLGNNSLVIACEFGDNTKIAVKEFQGANCLVSDGIVGDCTGNRLLSKIKDIQIALNSYSFDLIVDGVAGINTYIRNGYCHQNLQNRF